MTHTATICDGGCEQEGKPACLPDGGPAQQWQSEARAMLQVQQPPQQQDCLRVQLHLKSVGT